MKTFGIIIIWACINVIRDTRVLGYVIDPYEHWDDSRSLYSNSGLQTKEVDGLNKPVVVLVPVDRNTNRDVTNEVDSKSITHPAHKTKRCKSLTPLRKVRLSAPLKEVNNDESESQSSHFMNKNEVAFPMSKLRNIAPVDDEETASMNGISIPRFPKNIHNNGENDEEDVQPNLASEEDDQGVVLGNRIHGDRKNKYLCYCIDKKCAQNSFLKPFYQRNKNKLGPKLLQNTDLYSQWNALAATNSQEVLGMKHTASRPIIATRKQGRKRPSNKQLKNKKCIPILVATDNPMKVRFPLTLESNRRPMSSSAVTNRYNRFHNNYQSFQSALGIPDTYCGSAYGLEPFQTPPMGNQRGFVNQPPLRSLNDIIYDNSNISPRPEPLYSSLQECIQLHGREFCTSSLESLPQHQFQNNYYQSDLEDSLKPSIEYTSGNCQQNIQDVEYGVTTGIESSNYHQQYNSYPQFPVIRPEYSGYSHTGYDNYLEDQVRTGVVDSSTEYIMRLPDDDIENGESSFDYYGDDGEEKSQLGSSNPQYAPDSAPNDKNSGTSKVEGRIESSNVSQEDSPTLGQPKNVIVQPGYTQHGGASGNEGNPADVDNVSVSYDKSVQDSSEGPVAPKPGVNDGAVESPLGATHDYQDIDKFSIKGDKQGSLHPGEDESHSASPIVGAAEGRTEIPGVGEQNQAAEETLGAPRDYPPGDEDGQSVPSTEETSSESLIVGKSYEPMTPSIHSSHPQEARQPAESALTTIEDDDAQSGTKPLPYIPVTEHHSRNGGWHEGSATVGYKGEFSGERLGAPNDHANTGKSEQRSITETDTLGNSPITYHSPRGIIQEYKKNHPVDQGYVGTSNPESLDTLLSGENTENPSRIHHLNFYDSTSAQPIMQEYMGGDYGQGEGSVEIPVLGQSQAANREKAGANNMVGSRKSNPTYLGKITTGLNSRPIDDIEDLEGTDLFYIGDGVKLPLAIKRLNDGSLALMISPKICKICKNFMRQYCPYRVPHLGQVRQERNDGMRIGKQVEEKVHSRWIRSTTIHDDESTEKSMSGDDSPGVTVMPIEKFAEKYNLTLKLGDNRAKITSWTSKNEKSILFDRKKENGNTASDNNAKDVKIVFSQPDSSEFQGSMERNQYIQDLLSIHDASDTERTTTVINTLDGISNPSPNNVWPNGRKKSMKNAADGFEYQLENPIMERIKYIKGEQLEHGKYKYQQSPDEAVSARMEVAKNILHRMKELIVEPNENGIR